MPILQDREDMFERMTNELCKLIDSDAIDLKNVSAHPYFEQLPTQYLKRVADKVEAKVDAKIRSEFGMTYEQAKLRAPELEAMAKSAMAAVERMKAEDASRRMRRRLWWLAGALVLVLAIAAVFVPGILDIDLPFLKAIRLSIGL